MKLKSLPTSFAAGVVSFLGSITLSTKMKRLVLLASVSGRLKEPATFNNETLAKLNQVMEMGKRDEALMVPVQLSNLARSNVSRNHRRRTQQHRC
jgi:hypothetical protein